MHINNLKFTDQIDSLYLNLYILFYILHIYYIYTLNFINNSQLFYSIQYIPKSEGTLYDPGPGISFYAEFDKGSPFF